MSLTSAAVVSVVAFGAPLAVRLIGLRIPELVLQIVAGAVVSTGLALDLHSLARPSTLARVPVFLAMLFIVRAAPALLYRPLATRPAQVLAAGLLQATSISIPIVAGTIGVDLGLIRPENYAALVTAGLLSVIVFPLLALPRLAGPRLRSAAVTQPSAQSAD